MEEQGKQQEYAHGQPLASEDSGSAETGKSISRRDVLKLAGVGGIGLLLGSAGLGGVLAGTGMIGTPNAAASSEGRNSHDTVPFHGKHQAGIITPAQDFLYFAAFDLTTTRLSEVADLFRIWTDASAKMSAGLPVGNENANANLPPADTGEAAGLSASKLTFTFGVGPSLFDARFGLAAKRPEALADLPAFSGDNLAEEWSEGDIGVQVCANDMQVAFHAIRNLARLARGTAVLKWTQEGFQRGSHAAPSKDTPRNLLGFKDGTGNPDTANGKLMDQVVWALPGEGQAWMNDGSYMVTRRIRMRIEVWDRSTLGDQEATFGRYRESGAPLGAKKEFDALPLNQKDEAGRDVIPASAHVRVAHGDGKTQILRRSYSYSNGMDLKTGQLDAGLFFICYQKDIRSQFTPIQTRLSKLDKLNEYAFHMGSAIFACFPGAREGGYLGEGLFS